MKANSLFLSLFLFLAAFSAQASKGGHFNKVVWIVFENENYADVTQQPDFANFARKGALFTNFIAEVHPSQGNYLAMIAGTHYGISSDKPVNLDKPHVGDLLEKAGMDWRVYAENYPGNCFLGQQSGTYVRRHVPFLSFTNVTQNPDRCGKIETDAGFDDDFTSGTLPEFSMYIPNIKNDGHDTGVDFAGKWLSKRFGGILNQPSGLNDVLFILTFDESGKSLKNHTYTVLLGSHIKAGTTVTAEAGHATLLKMIEDEFGLGNLGQLDKTAAPIQGIWQ